MTVNEPKGQAGVFLIALLINITMIVTLVAGAVGCAAYMIRAHEAFTGDIVMQQQLRFAAEIMTKDITYAETVQIIDAGDFSVLTLTRAGKKSVYEIKGRKLTQNTQPLTGDDQRSPVYISEFYCERRGAGTVLFTIKAYQGQSLHEFLLEGGAVMLNAQKMPRKEDVDGSE